MLGLAIGWLAMAPAAYADNNVGCGLGTQMWAGSDGFIVQMLATITNGSTATQTFGITSETSGCTRGGTITAEYRLNMFAGANIDRLARDMATGEGETLATLAHLMDVQEAERPAFYRMTKQNFAQIFASEETTAGEMLTTLRGLMAADPELQHLAQG
jgi:hypothetical protein